MSEKQSYFEVTDISHHVTLTVLPTIHSPLQFSL